MTTMHTPGPWYFGVMPGFGGICITRRPVGEYGPRGVIGDAPIAAMGQGGLHWERKYPVEANARLIAAAPDLLAVIDKFLEVANLSPPVDLMRELGALVKLAAAVSDKAKATAP